MKAVAPPAPKAPKPLEAFTKSVCIKDVWWVKIKGVLKKVTVAYISENSKVFGFTTEKPSRENLWQPEIEYVSRSEVSFGDIISFDPLPGFPEAIVHYNEVFK